MKVNFTHKILLAIVAVVFSMSSSAYTSDDFVWDFEWLEPNNKIEIVVGEPYQLQFNCSSNKSKVFTSEYSENWKHYDFSPYQHIVEEPKGYSIDNKGVITGLIAGSYAIKFTGLIQAKSGSDKWLYITVVNEKNETESNNTFDTANEFTKKIKLSLYNMSDVDYVKYRHHSSYGTYLKFKVHYNGSGAYPNGFKWATFSGSSPQQMGGGTLMNQDQECSCLIYGGEYVYFELYFNPAWANYFSYNEYFTVEVMEETSSVSDTQVADENDDNTVCKYMINGKLLIKKGNKLYHVDGTLAK